MRYTPKGTPFARFSVAANRIRNNAEGQRQEDTDSFNVEAWGKLGEICQQYLKKSRLIYAEGRLHTDRWEKSIARSAQPFTTSGR